MRADLTRKVNVLVTALALLDHEAAFIEGGLVLREHPFCVVAHRCSPPGRPKENKTPSGGSEYTK
jgi:hypothetical protein